jgi:hypothetical protein
MLCRLVVVSIWSTPTLRLVPIAVGRGLVVVVAAFVAFLDDVVVVVVVVVVGRRRLRQLQNGGINLIRAEKFQLELLVVLRSSST